MALLAAFALVAALQGAPQDAPPEAPITVDGAPAIDERPLPDDVAGRLAKPRMLDLAAYSLYSEKRVPTATDGLRFDTEIEVVGRVKDPNEAMAEWWRHWDFEYSIYGHDINMQPKVAGGYNILPLIDWLRRKSRGENPDLWGRTKD